MERLPEAGFQLAERDTVGVFENLLGNGKHSFGVVAIQIDLRPAKVGRDVVAGAPPRPGGGVFYATRPTTQER